MQEATNIFSVRELIPEFIKALDDEIDAINNGKGGSVVKVSNGKFLRQDSRIYVYSFVLDSFLYTIDDAPIELLVGNTRYKGQVIQIQDQEVIIGLDTNLGSFIPEAKIINNLSFLLEELKKKLKESFDNNEYSKFELANFVFESKKNDTPQSIPPLSYEESSKKNNLNESQLRAVKISQGLPLTYVWGPPGTGKTHTLARIIESFIKRNKKVLLVSHANTAVDGAIKGVAEVLLHTDYYNNGKIIRLGNTPDEEIANKYELVLLDKLAAKFGEPLENERAALQGRKVGIEAKLESFSRALELIQNRNNLHQTINQHIKNLDTIRANINELEKQVTKLNGNLEESFAKLRKAESSNAIVKFFMGLDPEKIWKDIDNIKAQISSKQQAIASKKSEYQSLEAPKEVLESNLYRLNNDIVKVLDQYNLSETKLFELNKELTNEKNKIETKIAEIESELENLKRRLLSDADLVGTTLTKTFISREIADIKFDVLVLDEASMALMPQIYWALTKCKQSAVIVGDFLQLPPICVSNTDKSEKWLGRNIYQYLNINLDTVDADKRVILLDTQYRMNPDISMLSREIFYKNKLKDGENTSSKVKIANNISNSALTLIDTSFVAPWSSRLSTGSRFNIYNAILSAKIAESITKNYPYKVGIISPYGAQAKFIRKVLEDLSISDVQTSTVHKFQGSEQDIIIFDTVEGLGHDITGLLDDRKQGSDAKRLLNVAITRAESQIFLIGNIRFLEKYLSKGTALCQIIDRFKNSGTIIDCRTLLDTYLVRDSFDKKLEEWTEKFFKSNPSIVSELSSGAIHSEKSFYPALFADLRNAKEEVTIFSPFISLSRSSLFIELFRVLINKGIKIKLFTKPTYEQSSTLSQDAAKVIEQLEVLGVEITQRRKMHQKVVIIDKSVAWTGSLNILSHKDTGEQMVRITYQKTIDELINNLELDEISLKRESREIRTYESCSKCNSEMIIKVGRYGPYLFCPNCSNKSNLKKWDKIKTQIPCGNPECNHGEMVLRKGTKGWFLGCSNYPNCRNTSPL